LTGCRVLEVRQEWQMLFHGDLVALDHSDVWITLP